jgi:hypothetical protein
MTTRVCLLSNITRTYDLSDRPTASSSVTKYSVRATIASPPHRLPRPIRTVIRDRTATRARRMTTLTRLQVHPDIRTMLTHGLATQTSPPPLCPRSRLRRRLLSRHILHASPRMRSPTPPRTHTPYPTPPAYILHRRTPTPFLYPAHSPRSMPARSSSRPSPRSGRTRSGPRLVRTHTPCLFTLVSVPRDTTRHYRRKINAR